MDDTKITNIKNKFTKTRHRPWEKKLLEDKLSESSHAKNIANAENNAAYELDQNYTLQRQIIEKQNNENKDQSEIISKLNHIEEEPILIGGIFRPHLFVSAQTDIKKQEINDLLTTFQQKNTKLLALSNDLKLLKAEETAQQAIHGKAAEERLRYASEGKIQELMKQTQEATKELQLALKRAQEAELNNRKEHHLRKELQLHLEETKISFESSQKYIVQLENDKEELQTTNKQTLGKVIDLEGQMTHDTNNLRSKEKEHQDSEQDLKEHIEKLGDEIISYQNEIEKFELLKAVHTGLHDKLNSKETEILDLMRTHNEKIADLKTNLENKDVHNESVSDLNIEKSELENEVKKLKSIVKTEQHLRKSAEAKATKACDKISHAEQQLAAAQRKSKQAIKRANQTVMNFITQGDNTEDDEEQIG